MSKKILFLSVLLLTNVNANAEECADYCITLFSDLTRKVTMQNLFHDGGFSNMGMSYRAMSQYNKSFDEE